MSNFGILDSHSIFLIDLIFYKKNIYLGTVAYKVVRVECCIEVGE